MYVIILQNRAKITIQTVNIEMPLSKLGTIVPNTTENRLLAASANESKRHSEKSERNRIISNIF